MAHEQSRIGTYTLNLAVNVTLTITYITSLSLVECDSCLKPAKVYILNSPFRTLILQLHAPDNKGLIYSIGAQINSYSVFKLLVYQRLNTACD